VKVDVIKIYPETILVLIVQLGGTKRFHKNNFASLACQERMKMKLRQQNAKYVVKANTTTKAGSPIVPAVLLPKLRRNVPLFALSAKPVLT